MERLYKMTRLYGNIKDLEITSSNSTCDYYRLTLYLHIAGEWYPVTKEEGFSFYSKKEIYKILKNDIVNDLSKQGIKAR